MKRTENNKNKNNNDSKFNNVLATEYSLFCQFICDL